MSWAKLDDKFWSNPKVEAAGNEAAGAYARMLSYCGDHLTDGKLTGGAARFIAKPKTIDKLAELGFITARGDGWEIESYLRYNRSRAQVLAKREADKRRKADDE